MAYDWQLSLILEYWPSFLGGFILTMKLTIVTIVAGTLLGYVLGILLSLTSAYAKPLKVLINLYIAFFGWLPLLVLMVWMYYFLPVLLDVRFDGLTVSYIALSLNLSAFTTHALMIDFDQTPDQIGVLTADVLNALLRRAVKGQDSKREVVER